MGRLFLDPTLDFTDPASGGRKVLDAGTPSWGNPDAGRLALDAANSWAAPELFRIPDDIANASWADIEALSALAAQDPQSYMQYLGQTKVIDMSSLGNGVTNVTAMVIGIGQDSSPLGNRLGFTFQLRDGLHWKRMNESRSTAGGWRDSLMRSTYIQEVKNAMPEELRSRLKTMVKKTHITYSFDQLVETEDDIVPLSQIEVWGNTDPRGWPLPAGEGEQYQWYAAHNTDDDRVIRQKDGTALQWWLRSVRDSMCFRTVKDDGSLYKTDAGYGVAMPCACFCV